MARTLIIYDTEEQEGNTKNYILKFEIQYPDGKCEVIEYGRVKRKQIVDPSVPKSHLDAFGKERYIITVSEGLLPYAREKCLQRIVNKLEDEGYIVYPDKLALFMNDKIQKLIMQKSIDSKPQRRN